jgi:uncharacterized protein (TIGR03437 family)
MTHKSVLVPALALSVAFAGFAQSTVPLNLVPSRIVGHPNPESNTSLASANPNLVEGRELLLPQGVALDTSVSPPMLYVADTGNNRVLAWKDATSFKNGQPADLVVGQQDLYHTQAGGPGSNFTAGLNAPSSLAVHNGDLYIADTGNNRILRFRKPFSATVQLPDLYLGQPTINSRVPNYTGQVDAKGIFFASGSTGLVPGMAFDAKTGDLWITDPGNRRVLRFAAGDVQAGGGPLQANLVIGQLTFQDPLQPPVNDSTRTEPRYFAVPQAIAFDSSGQLYVSDSYTVSGSQLRGRVLVFLPPFSNGMQSSRIMGVVPPNPSNPPSADAQLRTYMGSPSAIFFINAASKIGVVDQFYNRILLFDSYEKWPDPSVSFSPVSTDPIVGQLTASALGPNGATDTYVPAPSDSVFNDPSAAVFVGSDLYIADTSNHRVLDMPFQNGAFTPARAALGQDLMDMSAPNLIEGREFYFTGSSADAGLAIDGSGDTPHLYVADTYNNRVLGYNDYRQLKAGMAADLVIGQADFKHGLCNGNGDPNHPSATTLCVPTGLVVDSSGNLYVADTGNGRVLRFPAPFAHQGAEQADLVLGQRDFKTIITDPTQVTMKSPYGLALTATDGLLVSDVAHNRVLFFRYTNGGFSPSDSGKPAEKVLGQPDFTTITSGSGDRQLSAPHGVAFDAEGRPYVTDPGNNRVVIYDQINNNQNGAPAVFKLSLSSPRGVYVSSATDESWITDTNNNGLVKKFPKFQTLLSNPAPTAQVQAAGPALAVIQDQYGDLIVADATNRAGFYFPGLQAINGANFMVTRDLAPGMFAAICSPNSACDPNKRVNYLGTDTARADQLPNPLPLPTTLADLQVLLNGNPVPLSYVSPGQINFYIPMNIPSGGSVDVQVIQKSTGRIYAAGSAGMNTYSPGIYTLDFGTNRQAAVLNQDGSVNSPTNPAPRGSIISIYATGQGAVPNAPVGGSPAPSSPLLTTPFTPQINIAGQFVDDYPRSPGDPPVGQFVQFSGLAPGLVGVWQINVYIPMGVAAGSQVPILVFAGSLPSNDFSQTAYRTVIAVKNP